MFRRGAAIGLLMLNFKVELQEGWSRYLDVEEQILNKHFLTNLEI